MASDIPWEIRLTLRAGSVYYFQEHGLTSAEPHYFIVINSQPLEQLQVVLVVISSKIQKGKRLRADLPGTVVQIEPKDYDELKTSSIVDCNVIFRRSLSELVDRIRRKEVRHHKDLPNQLLDAIRAAVKMSTLVEEETKALID